MSEEWVEKDDRLRALEAELADFEQMKELPPELCPTCGDMLHSGECREFNPDDPEDWEMLPKAVRERYEKAEAEVERLKVMLCTVRKRFNLEHDSDCYA